MRKKFLCVGVSAVMAVSSIALPIVGFAAETEAEYITRGDVRYSMAVGDTRTYAADIEYGIDTVTLGVAITSMDCGDLEIAMILQDSGNMLPGDITEGIYPLFRTVDDEVFVNGNTFASCFQILTGEDDFSEWMENVFPETGWICVDEDFLSMAADVFERMPDSWDFQREIEKWADSLYVTENDSTDEVIAINETVLLALTMTLDQIGRSCLDSVNTFLTSDLKERFGDDITDAMVDSGSFSDRNDAETMMENGFLNLQNRIRYSLFGNRLYGLGSLLHAFYDTDLTGLLLQGIGCGTLEGTLEIGDEYGKLTLTADEDTFTLEAGGSDTLIWGRAVDSSGELQASLVINNSEKEKAILYKFGGEYINVRMSWQEPDGTILVSVQDGINRNQISGLITVEEDDSIVFTVNSGVYGPLKSIRLYSTQEELDDDSALEAPVALDLDTFVYKTAYGIMTSHEAYEDETE